MARPIKDPTADAISGLSKAIESQPAREQAQSPESSSFANHLNRTIDKIAGDKVRLYGIGSNATALHSDLEGIRGVAAALGKLSEITFADVEAKHTRFIPQPMAWDESTMSTRPDPSKPERWELDVAKAVKDGILESLKLQPVPYEKPQPVEHPHADFGKKRLSTSARAARATQETPWENSGNVNPGATFNRPVLDDIPDLNNPPRFSGGGAGMPPGGNDPPGPPDEPDDNDGILRQLLEFFQRMLGVRPDIDRSVLDTLANNLTSILGGTPAQAGADGQQPSSVATLMDTFADYFNVPRETEEATREAQETLRRSIDRLTDATNSAANGGTPAQPQGRFARFRSLFRRGRGRRGGIATATRIASFVRPVLTRIGNLVPQRFRNSAAQMGQNVVGGIAQRFGVPAATAARFGAALGPAAAGFAVLRVALPILGTGISFAAKGLKHLSDEAMKTTLSLVRYSGSLSAANATLEVGREMRNFRIANRIQGHGNERIRLQNRIEEEWVPITTAMTNIGNQLGIVYDNIVLIGLKFANKLGELQVAREGAFQDFNQALRDAMNDDRKAKGLPPLKPNEGPQANAGGNNNGDVMFAGREAVFGQNAPDMVDFNRRQRGPRRPVNGGN